MTLAPGDTGIVITMAGAGSRFAQAGYRVPKYEVDVHGRTLFAWSMHSLRNFIDAGSPFVFVVRNTPAVAAFLERQCDELGIRSYKLAVINELTDGQATSAMFAREVWDDIGRPMAIYNIDTYVEPTCLPLSAIRGNGWLPCFPGDGDKWSFAAADETGRVNEVREKQRISPYATIGLYWFDSLLRYVHAYERYYSDPRRLEARERYIAPLYNHLIAEGDEVYLHTVRARDVYPLGTPEDVMAFASGPAPECRRIAGVL